MQPAIEQQDRAQLTKIAEMPAGSPGLPNHWYTADGAFQQEREAIYAKTWFSIGFASDVPGKGDIYPVDFMGLPLLIVRDRKGQVRVFHNVCSHRGMKLADKPLSGSTLLRCPYHSWCYDLTGSLRSTPFVGGVKKNSHPAVKRDEHGLRELRSAVYLDTVLVTLSEETPAFEDYAKDLLARWPEFGKAELYSEPADSSIEMELACNWKLAIENYLESYHLPWVHPSLNSYSRIEDHDYVLYDSAASGQVSLAYRPALGHDGQAFPRLTDLAEEWDGRGEYLVLYPNTLFGLHNDHLYAIVVEPRGAEATRERVLIHYFDQEAAGDAFSMLRQANTQLWKQVFLEDIFAVEGMQAGRHSPGFSGGVITPVLEQTTQHFHAWSARQLLASER